MVSQARSEVKKLIAQLSYREGDFTLSSGQKSTFYIDLKASTLHPDGAYWIAEATYELCLSEALKISAVGGLTLGADPLATALSLSARQRGTCWPAFIVRKEPKAHGTSRWIEGIENIPTGSPVLILEDVVTTGESSIKAIQHLRHAGFKPCATLTVVDREAGGAERITREGVPFYALLTLKEIQCVIKSRSDCNSTKKCI